jgi:hypothetical protein
MRVVAITGLLVAMVTGCAAELDQEPCDFCVEPGDADDQTVDRQQVAEVCYPGDGQTQLCLPVYRFDPVPAELVYTQMPADSYFDGNPEVSRDNYRAPIAFLDLDEAFARHGQDVMLYPSFRLDEIGQERVGRWAVIQPHAFARLQALRDALGPTSVISGYRSPGYNSTGGGSGRASASRHMWGDAFDFDPPVGLTTAKKKCLEMGAYFTNLYTTHIHCDWRQEPVDERFFGRVGRAARHPAADPAAFGYGAEIVWADDDLRVDYQGFDEGEPVVEWHALDASGESIAWGDGPRFEPPVGAVKVRVTVGGWLVRELAL